MGFPIRKSPDQRVLSPPRGLSQSATSFIASCRQGIHQTPFSRLIASRKTTGDRSSRLRSRSPGPHVFPTQATLAAPAQSAFLDLERRDAAARRAPDGARPCDASRVSLHDVNETAASSGEAKRSKRMTIRLDRRIGGACRARTGDPLLAKQMLSQLS